MSVISARRGFLFASALLATLSPIAAHAADYLTDMPELPELRGSYSQEWGIPENPSPIGTELGLRYWYSMGAHGMQVLGGNYVSSDTSHILEAHARIDDYSTSSFLKAYAGYAAVIEGTYNTPTSGGTQTSNIGQIAYGTADFGYMPFGNETIQFGALAGYSYQADNPDMGRVNFVNSSGGFNSETNDFDLHALRLGLTTEIEVNHMLDLRAEAVAIPYAHLSGTYGALGVSPWASGGDIYQQGSAGTIYGDMYGAAGEIMVGLHPTDNLTLRVGGRAQYLTGNATMSFTGREVGSPSNSVEVISDIDNIEFFRYGLLAELTASF